MRHLHDLAGPSSRAPDRAYPFRLGQHGFVCDVVCATLGPLVGHDEGDGGGYVLDIAPRGAPAGEAIIEQDGRAAVVHALDVVEQPMVVIAWAVHERQAQHGAREGRDAHNRLLHEDVVVVLRVRERVDIGIPRRAQRCVLSQGHVVGWPRLQVLQSPIGAIHVHAAQHDDPPRDPRERRHDRLRVALGVGDSIQHNVGREALEVGGVIREALAVAVQVSNGRQVDKLGFATVKHRHVMAHRMQARDRRRANKLRAADH